MVQQYLEMYEAMICEKICKYRGVCCDDNFECQLAKEEKELKKKFAEMILEDVGAADDADN